MAKETVTRDFPTKLATAQSEHFARTGKYLQVLPTHKEVPEEGKSVLPDSDRRKLADEPADLIEATASDVMKEVHEHVGPKGCGYTVIERQKKGNTLYQRATGHGLYSATYDWREVLDGTD